jgi:hypothetical protein
MYTVRQQINENYKNKKSNFKYFTQHRNLYSLKRSTLDIGTNFNTTLNSLDKNNITPQNMGHPIYIYIPYIFKKKHDNIENLMTLYTIMFNIHLFFSEMNDYIYLTFYSYV